MVNIVPENEQKEASAVYAIKLRMASVVMGEIQNINILIAFNHKSWALEYKTP